MADTAFHLFPPIASPTGSEVVPVDDGSAAGRVTLSQIAALASGGRLLAANALSELAGAAATARSNIGAAADASVMHLTGTETVAGAKTFSTRPVVGTAAGGTNDTAAASTAFVAAAITALVNGAPGALDALNELAAALGNDANFATTVTNALALKAPAASPSFTGPITSEGVDIFTPYDMPALAINVARKLNRKTIAVDSTLTFSAALTANSLLALELANSASSGVVVTHPSVYDVNKQATSTSFVLPALASITLLFKYDGTTTRLSGTPGAMHNIAATTDPAVTDDSADGYGVTSLWVNTTAGRVFVCRSAAVGAAVWAQISGSIPAGTPRAITGAATLAAADVNTTLRFNSASTAALTVPSDATLGITGAKVGNSAIVVYIQAAGVPTFTASGSTINGSPRAGLATNDTIVLNHTGIANTWSYA